MRVIIEVTVDCTITDQFKLLELARAEVDALKPVDERNDYYPSGPTEALQQVIRSSIAARLQSCGVTELHEIGHAVQQIDLPF